MIVVTGMHRSGTSLVCQFMHELGISFGDAAAFYEPDKWNEPGYFESKQVMDLNSRIITGFPRNKTRIEALLSKAVYATMPGEAVMWRRAGAVAADFAPVVARHRGCAVKDPRFCLTLPVWEPVAGIDKVIVCIRHPADTAHSLRRRDHFPLFLSYRFWTYHIDALMRYLPASKSILIDMDRLAGEDCIPELELLVKFLGFARGPGDLAELHRKVFRPGLLKSGRGDIADVPIRVRLSYDRLKALAERIRREVREERLSQGAPRT